MIIKTTIWKTNIANRTKWRMVVLVDGERLHPGILGASSLSNIRILLNELMSNLEDNSSLSVILITGTGLDNIKLTSDEDWAMAILVFE
jgi:hypothetical protein